MRVVFWGDGLISGAFAVRSRERKDPFLLLKMENGPFEDVSPTKNGVIP